MILVHLLDDELVGGFTSLIGLLLGFEVVFVGVFGVAQRSELGVDRLALLSDKL